MHRPREQRPYRLLAAVRSCAHQRAVPIAVGTGRVLMLRQQEHHELRVAVTRRRLQRHAVLAVGAGAPGHEHSPDSESALIAREDQAPVQNVFLHRVRRKQQLHHP